MEIRALELGTFASSRPGQKELSPSGLLRSSVGNPSRREADELWRLFAVIGELWGTSADGSASMRSRWAEFIETRCNRDPSYLEEYRSAVRVLDELFGAHGRREVYEGIYLNRADASRPALDRFERMRKLVCDEFIAVHLSAGGFASFGGVNALGYVGGLALPPAASVHVARGDRGVRQEYDYIVVGSGVAGGADRRPDCSTTTPHSRSSCSRPVLEFRRRTVGGGGDYVVTGRRPYAHAEDLPEENVSEGRVRWGFPESRLMIYGGSTMHWGGWSLRFKPEDFRLDSNTGRGADWPIDYEELTPHYRSAEALLNVSGDAGAEAWRASEPYALPPFPYTAADGLMIDALKALNISYAPLPVSRARKCMTTGTCKYCPFGARFSASYVWDALLGEQPAGPDDGVLTSTRFPGLTLRVHSPVSRLLMSERRSTVRGVEFVRWPAATDEAAPPGSYGAAIATADRVVLAAGAIETPKLLQRSRHRHWPNGVGNDHDLVGRYVITHPFLFARGSFPDNPRRWQQEMDFPTLMSRHFDTEAQQKTPEGKLLLFKSRSRPRVKLVEHMRAGKTREELERIVHGPMEFELQGFIEEFSNFHNRVENGPGLNRFGLPQTRVGFSRNPDFDRRVGAHLERMKNIMQTMGCRGVRADIRGLRGDHASATCRMAHSPEQGVVDEDLRVHDVDNLYVCSNAVFPSGAVVNPTLTLSALALRLAEALIANGPAARRVA